MKSYGPGADMKSVRKFSRAISLAVFLSMLLAATASAQNSVEGEVQFVGSNKAEKSAGVWIDGQYVVEPAKKLIITVKLDKDPNAQYSAVTSEVKLKVTPERAAVFVDGNFAGYVQQFSGMGRGMLVSPGAHHIKIALAGYQEFDTDVHLLPKQKITIKTELVAGSITQAPPAIKQN